MEEIINGLEEAKEQARKNSVTACSGSARDYWIGRYRGLSVALTLVKRVGAL